VTPRTSDRLVGYPSFLKLLAFFFRPASQCPTPPFFARMAELSSKSLCGRAVLAGVPRTRCLIYLGGVFFLNRSTPGAWADLPAPRIVVQGQATLRRRLYSVGLSVFPSGKSFDLLNLLRPAPPFFRTPSILLFTQPLIGHPDIS